MVLIERPPALQTLDGCCNLRDLGGYPTADGSRIRPRLLLRSDALTAASDADRRWLRATGLTTIIDLRSDVEVVLFGNSVDLAPTLHHLPLGMGPDSVGSVRWADPEDIASYYFELLLAGGDTVSEVLAVLTDPATYPAVLHCSIGKDRTGILVALILSLLGVAEDDIVTDYALSGIGAARLALRLRDQLVDRPAEFHSLLPALLSAHPETMRHFLTRIRDEFGSVEGYIEHLDLASVTGYLRDALLEPSHRGTTRSAASA